VKQSAFDLNLITLRYKIALSILEKSVPTSCLKVLANPVFTTLVCKKIIKPASLIDREQPVLAPSQGTVTL